MNMREACHQCGAKTRFEFIEFRCIDDACDDFAYIVGFTRVGRNDAVEFLRIKARRACGDQGLRLEFTTVQPRHRIAGKLQGMCIVGGKVIDHAG